MSVKSLLSTTTIEANQNQQQGVDDVLEPEGADMPVLDPISGHWVTIDPSSRPLP
jgi:hypothetical protein